MKIVILDGHAVNPGDLTWECLEQFGEVIVYPRSAPENVVERIGDAQIVMTNKTAITEEVLTACPSVKLVCVLATGYNVVDIVAARKRGIPVTNVPGYGTAAVVQFTFSLLLEMCNAVAHHSSAVHGGKWTACPDFCFWDTPQVELAGKTIGIIGFGTIGRGVGSVAKAFGMNVLAYNRSRCEEGEAIGRYVDLDTLLEKSDVISLHCPLTDATKGIINAETIEKMKDGAFLINTARGPVVDEAAVAAALRDGKLAGFAADVVSEEPILASNPLLGAPNCILTPHIAWAPLDSRKRILTSVEKSVRGFLSGNPVNVVNP